MSSPTSQLKSVVIQAGAGAGKTTTLIRTFIENARKFKQHTGRHPRMVVTTFTRKATQELRERLFTEAYAQNDQELVEYLNRKSWVHISTIHGLLVPFLSRYGVKVGLNPELKVVSNSSQDLTLKRLCKKAFQSEPRFLDLLEELNWKELISQLNQYSSARLAFGQLRAESSEDLRAHSKKILDGLQKKQKSLTQVFLSLDVTEKWQEYFRYFGSEFNTWEELDAWYDRLPSKPAFRKATPPFDESIDQDIKLFLEEVKSSRSQPLLRQDNWQPYEDLQKLFSEFAETIFPQLLQAKFDTGQLTMSDLELLTLEVIRRDPVCAVSFSQEWDYWMVDEYQDTSPLQVKILNALIGTAPHFVVGDPQQSIYLFRGARAEVFEDKVSHMLSGGHEKQELMRNYRSRHEIVHFFNEIFPRLSTQFTTMEASSKRQDSSLRGAHITLIPSETSEIKKYSNEVLTVLAQVQDLLEAGVKPDSIAILARTNRLLHQFVKASHEYKIAVQCPSLSSYWNRREILDLLLLSHFLLNPHNNLSLIGLFRSPWFFVPDEFLSQIQDASSFWKKSWEIHEKVEAFHAPLRLLKILRDRALEFGVSSALSQFLAQSDFLEASLFYDSTGRREANIWKFLTELRARESQPGANIIEFLDEILEEESTDVENSMGEATPVVEPNRVTLMTVHASKGLQFDHVFVVGLGNESKATQAKAFSFDEETLIYSIAMKDDEGKLMFSPLALQVRDRMREREQAESLRVFYVALTRARESLWLSTLEKSAKSSIWSVLPVAKEEGRYDYNGGFYEVQKINRTPTPMLFESLRPESRLGPLNIANFENTVKKSVTGLLHEDSVIVAKKSSGDKVKALERAQKGTHAHRIFEALALRKGETLEVRQDWIKAVEYIQKLQNPPMLKIFERGHPEWGFAVKMDSFILQGSIDIWAELDEKVFIIDYKTGRSTHVESAFEQMHLYSTALKKMNVCSKNKPHVAVAIFPFEEKVFFKNLENKSPE